MYVKCSGESARIKWKITVIGFFVIFNQPCSLSNLFPTSQYSEILYIKDLETIHFINFSHVAKDGDEELTSHAGIFYFRKSLFVKNRL